MESPPTTLGRVRDVAQSATELILDCGTPRLSLQFLGPGTVRVRLAPDGHFRPRRSWSPLLPSATATAAPAVVEQDAARILARTEEIQVVAERDPCTLSFHNREGAVFCADLEPMSWRGGPSPGVASTKILDADEHFYGFGERTGGLDKRGRRLTNWTSDPLPGHGPLVDPLYMAVPVFLSLRPGLAYGLLLNCTWRSHFDIGAASPDRCLMDVEAPELDYVVVYGPRPADVTARLASVTGTMPMPPLWALGYHQSRWSYETADRVRAIAHEFRRRRIPCDAVHIDIHHMDGYRVFTWDPDRFPDPAGLMLELRDLGFHAVTIVDPGVKADDSYSVFREGKERGFFIRRADGEIFQRYVWPGLSAFPDFARRDVRDWWGLLVGRHLGLGVEGVWNDMNEPTVFARPFEEGGGGVGTIDLDAPQGAGDERTVHGEVHNLYASQMAQATYEAARRHVPGRRTFILTRAGFTGVQRWSASWTGDNASCWEHLEMAMPQMMNMSVSGIPFVGTDIGGFGGEADGELFARWMQLGALSPFCRGHSCIGTRPHEPWAFGEEVESICREFLELRYRLLPYLYSVFRAAHSAGSPVLRPLFYEFPDDRNVLHLHDQFLVGPCLMAAPVYRPGRAHRHVYLPPGAWYDWWTGEPMQGPRHVLADAPLNRMPIYARGGFAIPCRAGSGPAGDADWSDLILEVFPGERGQAASGGFELYEDDGISWGYEQGEFRVTRIDVDTRRSETGENLCRLRIAAPRGEFPPSVAEWIVRLHRASSRAAEIPGIVYDPERRTGQLCVRRGETGEQEIEYPVSA